MKSALILSFTFHVAAGLIWSLIVEITQVRFVPRQVYSVDIVTPAELPKPRPAAPKQEEASAPAPEPVKQDEEVVPPERPRPKPRPKPEPAKPKAVEKTMPEREEQAEPTPEEATPEPVVTGDISLDGEDFPFAYYLASMRRKIAAFWQPGGGEEKFCVVYFRVGRDGSILSPTIETSSGNLVFDQAALRAVHRANPLPALPPAYTEQQLGVHFSFSYIRE